jgi:hypothetical protein
MLPIIIACRLCCAVVSYTGHDSRINSVCFTHSRYRHTDCGGSGSVNSNISGKSARAQNLLPSQVQAQYQLLSSSADGTARMWRSGVTDGSVVTFSHVKHSVGDAGGQSTLTAKANSNTFTGTTKHTGASKGSELLPLWLLLLQMC